MSTHLVGVGHYLPQNIVPNTELERHLDTTDAWIQQRTGIKQRHQASKDTLTSDLGYLAAKQALNHHGIITPQDIDIIIVATSTADRSFPATAMRIQALLGAHKAFAFDIQAVCSGFVYALATADSLLKSMQKKYALVIGAETFTRLVDQHDRSTAVLFGDGAGAFLLEHTSNNHKGILGYDLYSDGTLHHILECTGGIALNQQTGITTMNGKEVFRHAVEKMTAATKGLLHRLHLDHTKIDWLVPHQANGRILSAVAQHLDIPDNKVISCVHLHANTSAASIPLAFSVGVHDGRIQHDHLIMMTAMGAGLTWGSLCLQY
jgi:3-oxoacyl-[acyl-carrier-protein] synthase III